MGNGAANAVSAPGGKKCVICGVDCAGRPRVKDPRGRYFCRPCYDSRASSPDDAFAGGAAAPELATHGAASIGRLADPDAIIPDFGASRDDAVSGDDALSLEPLPPPMVGPGAGRFPGFAKKAVAKSGGGGRPIGAVIKDFLVGSRILAVLSSPLALLISYAAVLPERVDLGIGLLAGSLGARGDAGGAGPDWGFLYAVAGLMAIIPALLMWILGPLWFRARLRWSGGASLEPRESRLVYFPSVIPYILWTLPFALSYPALYDRPADVLADPSMFLGLGAPLIGVGLLIVTTVALFLVAVHGYGAGIGKAAFWHLALPIAWYGLTIAATFVILAAAGSVKEIAERAEAAVRTDVTRTHLFEARTDTPYTFSYPANWTLTERAIPGAEFRGIELDAPDGSEMFIMLGPAQDIELADYAQHLMKLMMKGVVTRGAPRTIERLGRFNGQGLVQSALNRGKLGELTLFLRPVGSGRRLVILYARQEPDLTGAQAGFDLIVNSLKVTER